MMESEIRIPLKPAIGLVGRPLSEESLREQGFFVPLYSDKLERLRTFLSLHPGSRCLLVCGKDGVGKTTFVNRALVDIQKQGSPYHEVLECRTVVIEPKDLPQILQEISNLINQWAREVPPPPRTLVSIATHIGVLAESLQKAIPWSKGGEITVSTEKNLAGKVGVSATELSAADKLMAEVKLNLPEDRLGSALDGLTRRIRKVSEKERWATQPLLGIPKRVTSVLAHSARNIIVLITGRKPNLYVLVLDGLHKIEKTSQGEGVVRQLLERLSECIEEHPNFKIIAIAGPRTYKTWHDMGGRSTRALGVDDALYLPCAWDSTDLIVRQLVEEPQSLEETRKTKVLNDLSAYLRFFGQGRIATTLLHLEKCCTIGVQAKKGTKSPCLQLNIGMETLEYVAELQRRIEKEIFEIARSDFHWAEVELDDLIEEIYTLLTDLLRTPIGEYFEYDGQSYSFHTSSAKQVRTRRREVGYPKYLEKALAILEKMGYIAQDVQIFPEAKKT